ncbi:MAG: Glycine/D-amino acid oxidases (deaminating) [Rhodobacteraceae bacterium HLUCCA08]|nr:MAG: Glycine/D-amino acid oxidases (deaminating) [Rhodobacteraceae bacterium HLUCCA08]
MKVVVIGAGIVGAAAAYRLARGGADVTVIDGQGPGAGATGRSFGWINASFHHDARHFRLRAAAMAAWRALAAELELPLRWDGALWWEGQGAALAQMETALRALDYPVERLSGAALRGRVPALAEVPDAALAFPSEGVADPRAVAEALLRASGARLIVGQAAEAIETAGDAVASVRLGGTRLSADRVVVAAGCDAPGLVAPLGVALPMKPAPGLLVETAPVPFRLDPVLVSPMQEVRQVPGGGLMAPSSADHQRPDAPPQDGTMAALADTATDRLRRMFGLDQLGWTRVVRGERPVPADDLPVLGAAGPAGLVIAVMHSGVTLAPLAGRAVAEAVLGNGPDPDLWASYRVDRFG